MGQNDKKGTVSPKQGQLVPLTRIHCCLVESASQQGRNNSAERGVTAPRSPRWRGNRKSNYEHLVLTASCLKADSRSAALHHVRGRSALILQMGTHPDATVPAVPNNVQLTTVPCRGFCSLFLFLGNGSLGQNFHRGTKLRVSQKQNCSLTTAASARQYPWGALGAVAAQRSCVAAQKATLAAEPWLGAAPERGSRRGSPRCGTPSQPPAGATARSCHRSLSAANCRIHFRTTCLWEGERGGLT